MKNKVAVATLVLAVACDFLHDVLLNLTEVIQYSDAVASITSLSRLINPHLPGFVVFFKFGVAGV